jgi:Holliday junction resolvase
MSTKRKGINAERELIHKFWNSGWTAIRVAGSGSSKYPSPDIIAANISRKLAIEAKLTKEDKKYFTKQDIDQINEFSEKFGAEAWLAVKFPKSGWFFLPPSEIDQTPNGFVFSLKKAKTKGLSFNELLNEF